MENYEINKENNQSLGKALLILQLLVSKGQPMRLHDIANELGFQESTTLRFLRTYKQFNYVKQDPETHRYSLTLKISQLGQIVNDQLDIRHVARPYLMKLVDLVGESACLAIEEKNKAIYVDVHHGPDSIIKITQKIGKEAPLHCTGVGKLLLASHSRIELQKLAENIKLEKLTNHTITDWDLLLDEIDQIQKLNYSIDDQECEMGVRCIAAPIRDYSSKIKACISVSGLASRMTFKKIEFIKTHIMDIAYQISKEFGYVQSDL